MTALSLRVPLNVLVILAFLISFSTALVRLNTEHVPIAFRTPFREQKRWSTNSILRPSKSARGGQNGDSDYESDSINNFRESLDTNYKVYDRLDENFGYNEDDLDECEIPKSFKIMQAAYDHVDLLDFLGIKRVQPLRADNLNNGLKTEGDWI